MNDLIKAAKAVIDTWSNLWVHVPLSSLKEQHNHGMRKLREAVDKADNLPSDFHEWYSSPDSRHLSGSYQNALETWYCAQQAAIRVERERIKQIITYQFGELVSDLSEVMEMIDDD